MFKKYDLIVVGGGHAGCEAAASASNLGASVLLITMNLRNIAQMSCNPAMGGVAKGQIIREIDALGGYSGIITDKTMIQFRMLNKSKGPAMWSPRAQSDRIRFALEWRMALEKINTLDLYQEMVTKLLINKNKVIGVQTALGIKIYAESVVLTNGTFLNGTIHIGKKQFGGGRIGENKSIGLTKQLANLGFQNGRMKTGTPPRVDGRSLNYHLMEEQKGDTIPNKFSFTDTKYISKQRSCYFTYTNTIVHDILKTGFYDSPMFNGRIKGKGPRYCPSIEDKIDRFADKDRHQIFVEPEGWNTVEMYINGFSSSLSEDVQYKALSKIPGFENVKIYQPGYAIEYDFFYPTQLHDTLETKLIDRLYFAGQINGTTGYEEAAAQGLIAGINAYQKLNNKPKFVLKRSDAYIGVLVDDLVHKGTDEPYRMFTSRAEYRILLRQDNADLRLTNKGYELGLISNKRMSDLLNKEKKINEKIKILHQTKIKAKEVNKQLEVHNKKKIKETISLAQLLTRPDFTLSDYKKIFPEQHLKLEIKNDQKKIMEEVEILIKYEYYIEKEKELAKKFELLDNYQIPNSVNYMNIKSLSIESREKLNSIQPSTLGQASRISGVSPSDINILMIYFKN